MSFEPGRFVTVNAPLTFWVLQVYPNLGYGRIGPGVRIAMASTVFA